MLNMIAVHPEEDPDTAQRPESRSTTPLDPDEHAVKDPRATAHPTGEKRAAENAENEPAG